ncbi:hypothetical protein Aduo_000811 [Ancylostoma duodenale]
MVIAKIIDTHLCTQLGRHGVPDCRPRIILDFEKAAIKAARKVLPRSTVEGCVFHLGQAWTRHRNSLGLTAYTQDEKIPQWLNGGKSPTETAMEFIDYMRDTWLTGPFKDSWCKFGIHTLRTTNTAEAYHRKLKDLFKCAHPPLATLIKALRGIDLQAQCMLKRRRERVEKCMRRFNVRYQTRGATNGGIERYCKKMSRFVACKAI